MTYFGLYFKSILKLFRSKGYPIFKKLSTIILRYENKSRKSIVAKKDLLKGANNLNFKNASAPDISVSSLVFLDDSAVIDIRPRIDKGGAEKLLGPGDMLVKINGDIMYIISPLLNPDDIKQILKI